MRRVKLPGNFVQAGSCDKNGRGKQLGSSCLRQREFVAFEAAENLPGDLSGGEFATWGVAVN